MHTNTKEAYKLLHDGILALEQAERQGLQIDLKYIEKTFTDIDKKVEELENSIYASKFYKKWKESRNNKKPNIYSSTQLSKYLYDVRGIKVKKETKKGGRSTDEETLRLLNIPELNTFLEIKKLKKVKDYLDQYKREQVNGIIHPFFNLHSVRTFRSSSDRPNFQNVPKRDKESMQIVRRAIYPRKGHQFLELDYSQLEVRIAACYSKDKKLTDDILNGDMHGDMAKEIFKIRNFDRSTPEHNYLRAATKNGFVFPQFYGSYYKNCAINLACEWCKLPQGRFKSETGVMINKNNYLSDHLIKKGLGSFLLFERHIQKIEDYFWGERYNVHADWRDNIWNEYQKNGYVTSHTGFTFQGVMSRNDVSNYPVQGAAFHCLLWSLIEGTKAFKREKFDSVIVGQIHDAIVIDLNPKELDRVLKIMECIMCNDVRQHWQWITVPLEIEAEICPVNGSWADKNEIKIH
jgi:DNA polymerase-1